jgi:hypothetical protein
MPAGGFAFKMIFLSAVAACLEDSTWLLAPFIARLQLWGM